MNTLFEALDSILTKYPGLSNEELILLLDIELEHRMGLTNTDSEHSNKLGFYCLGKGLVPPEGRSMKIGLNGRII